jgi:hypothetical protein
MDRARAYNGVCSLLVTEDGAPIPAATGAVRATAPLRFPTETVKASTILPDLDKYTGPPLEFGRMEATASDPAVQQQYGMITGKPNAGQLNALATLNIRGERSVTCRGDFDRHPSEGPLPLDAPPVCEEFRRLPDALERAAELDAAYGRNPDLDKMPMYGVAFSFKDPYDTKDMRTTAGGDAAYAIDFGARPCRRAIAQQGRNHFRKAVCTEYNGRAGDPGGRHKPAKVLPSVLGYQRSSWGGNPANPYDTTRAASLGSSSGSGVSVSANLVMCSLGEETRASTRGPANHNAVALILPHKSLLGFNGGAIGADIYCDRSGILARTIADAAKVLDALKDPDAGYYDPRDPYTTVPRPIRRRRAATQDVSAAQGNAHRRHPRVDAAPPWRQRCTPNLHCRRCRDQGDPRREARRDIGRILRSVMGTRSRPRADEPRFPAGPGEARAGVHAGPALPAGPGRPTIVPGIRSGDPSDRIRSRQNFWQRHDDADRLLRRAGRRPDRAARQSRHRHDPGAGAGDVFPLPCQPIPVARAADWRVSAAAEALADFAALNARLQILGR